MYDAFNATSTMDSIRAHEENCWFFYDLAPRLFHWFLASDSAQNLRPLLNPVLPRRIAERLASLLDNLRRDYLSGGRGPAPASRYLNKTRPVYEFVRVTLGIRMHGSENYHHFEKGLGVEDVTFGQNVSLIHEAIRDGKMHSLIVSVFSSFDFLTHVLNFYSLRAIIIVPNSPSASVVKFVIYTNVMQYLRIIHNINILSFQED
jgi:phenylalanine ammonia-lyase